MSSWSTCVCHFRLPRFPSYVPPAAQVRLACCSPQVSSVSGTPDQISDGEVPIPLLRATSPPQPSARAAAPLPADSDDEVPIPRFSHRTALVSCYGDAEVALCAPEFLAFPPPPPLLLFALNLPCRLAATADALSGMVNSDLLLLLLLLLLLCRCADHACHLMHGLIALSLADQDCWFLLTERLQTECHICLGAPSGRSGGGCAGGRQSSSFLVCLCAHMRICFDNSRP
jgi:hypothetical protein